MASQTKLSDTMQPVIKAKDVMQKFGCCRNTALKIMHHKSLCGYDTPAGFVVEKVYWDIFINKLLSTGGTSNMSMATGMSDSLEIKMFIAELLKADKTEQDDE